MDEFEMIEQRAFEMIEQLGNDFSFDDYRLYDVDLLDSEEEEEEEY